MSKRITAARSKIEQVGNIICGPFDGGIILAAGALIAIWLPAAVFLYS